VGRKEDPTKYKTEGTGTGLGSQTGGKGGGGGRSKVKDGAIRRQALGP